MNNTLRTSYVYTSNNMFALFRNSCTLYILVFIIMLPIKASNNKNGFGFSLAPRTTEIPCLFFAYDSLILYKTSSSSCNILKNTIIDFCNLSGQLVNFYKSTTIFSKQVQNFTLVSIFTMTKSTYVTREISRGVFLFSKT